MMKPLSINVAAFIGVSAVNGPGLRSVVWLQGCSLNCPGCHNQSFRIKKEADILSIDTLFDMIMINRSKIQGVTYSGGEPFEQAEALYLLGLRLKNEGLNLMAYSGHTYERLKSSTIGYVSTLLGILDILVDGPFIESLQELSMWKGSSNQKVFFFNPDLIPENMSTHGEQLEIIINEDGSIILTGNYSRENIVNAFRSQGISEEFSS